MLQNFGHTCVYEIVKLRDVYMCVIVIYTSFRFLKCPEDQVPFETQEKLVKYLIFIFIGVCVCV